MKEAKLSKGVFRSYIRNTLIPSLVPNRLKEKKIGFNKGAEYDEEAADEFDDLDRPTKDYTKYIKSQLKKRGL